MELTLLQIVQRCLSAIDSHNVTGVDDSPDAEQVVLIVNRVYEEILSKRDWPFLRVAGTSLVTNTSGVPWELEFPANFWEKEYVRYNKKDVTYMSPSEFKYMIDGRDTTASYVNSSGIHTDRDPSYWTSFDEKSMVFDAYDSTNATLLPSLCYLQYIKYITSSLTANSDIPDLPLGFHSVLFDGVLAAVFNELAQDTTKFQMQERKYRTGLARMQRWARKLKEELPNYQKKHSFGRSRVL